MIDTHCHLTFPDFVADRRPGGLAGVLAQAREHGVTGCVTISTTTVDCRAALAIAQQFENVWCTAGVHPLYSDEGPHDWDAMRTVGQSPRCVAWGELGLDNHYSDPPRAVQHAVLEEQLAHLRAWRDEQPGGALDKPLMLHCREAFADLIPILLRSGLDTTRMVFHCFTGNATDMRRIMDIGAWVSFTGVATYKNAPALHEAVRLAPADRIMIETDAPFLSPHPHRGVRPCEPWMASVTARAVAELRGEAWEAFHARINDNTRRFLRIPVS